MRENPLIFCLFGYRVTSIVIYVLTSFVVGIASTPSAYGAGGQDEALTYNLAVVGLEGAEYAHIRKAFDDASFLKSKSDEVIVSVANLRGRIKADAELMSRVLRAEGYYVANVTPRTARTGNDFIINMRVVPGVQYVFGTIDFDFTGYVPERDIVSKLQAETALETGSPAIATVFVAAERRLDNILEELGFPFAKAVEHDLVVDHKLQTMGVTFRLDTDERMRVGAIKFAGLKTVNDSYVRRFVEIEHGDFYKRQSIDELRTRLIQSGLFVNVSVKAEKSAEDIADIVITLTEAEHRTIGATAGYSTAEGVGAEVSWEHRNMFNRGGVLKITARGAEVEQSLATRLELPNFARLGQTVSLENLMRRQDTDAFLSYEAEVRAGIDRIVTSNLALLAGGVLEYSDVTDAQGNREFLLASLPFGARWDSSDDLLNPSKGFRASLVTAPSINLGNNGFTFLKSEFRASTYLSLLKDQALILAFRGRLGSIIGAANNTLPATQRFFAGGGGSIRGFSFQNVGPLDVDGNPLGGRSVAELAAEVRIKVSRDFGIVPFIEGGNTYVDSAPALSAFRWGAGIGARYYTSFGPIRFDLATPLDRQPGESRLQFYVSLGQAF